MKLHSELRFLNLTKLNLYCREENRCQVSGFDLNYKVYEDCEKNTIFECLLDPEKEDRIIYHGL